MYLLYTFVRLNATFSLIGFSRSRKGDRILRELKFIFIDGLSFLANPNSLNLPQPIFRVYVRITFSQLKQR